MKPPSQKKLHNLVELPSGQQPSDVLAAFSQVTEEIHVGAPAAVCAGCSKPFTAVRKRRKAFRLYPMSVCQKVPIAFSHMLCGRCFGQFRRGGDAKEAIMAAIDAFDDGEIARQ